MKDNFTTDQRIDVELGNAKLHLAQFGGVLESIGFGAEAYEDPRDQLRNIAETAQGVAELLLVFSARARKLLGEPASEVVWNEQ